MLPQSCRKTLFRRTQLYHTISPLHVFGEERAAPILADRPSESREAATSSNESALPPYFSF